MNGRDLEEFIDRQLRALPVPKAPSTLLPRVLVAVESQLQRRTSPWAWSNWPRVLRLVSAGVMGVVLVGLAYLEPLAGEALAEVLSGTVQPVVRIMGDVRAALGAVEALRRVLVEPWLGYFVILGIMMGMACAAVAAALTHMISLGGESR